MPQDSLQEHERAQRAALRVRVRDFYRHFNRQDWDRCYEYLDPQLRKRDKVAFSSYSESLSRFAEFYGEIDIWHLTLNLHLDTTRNKQDKRPFAYVYIFWQDRRHAFHVFRERWIREDGDWYTRVVGLVIHPNKDHSGKG